MHDFPVEALRSVELGVPDIGASVEFYTKTWGLQVVQQDADKVFLAGSGDDFHILELKQSTRAELRKVTFRARSREDLLKLHSLCEEAGATVLRAPQALTAPSGGFGFVIREPQGCVLEFVHGDLRRQPSHTPLVPVRLAHVNINSAEIEALSDFYRNSLGFRLTDRSRMMAFLCCNQDHHSVVLAEAPVNGLNHIAFQMPDLESVMRGSGRVVDAGYPIGWGVGRHGPGDNVFAYFVDPHGVVIEYTAEVLQVDESYRVGGPQDWVWPPGRTDQWGIAPPKSEACKKAQQAVGFSAP
ncbi:VOC family protein [Allorhizobium undicola]|uniref:VOC family protein n=1 Tax=Allorhizobium undicola TaxID=78527 RepID=UPI00048A29CD|nr:VOC family protein [Allorhizobium undicola]